MAQRSHICPCIADTYTDSSSPDSNYGDSTILKLGSGGTETFYRYRAVFQFDLGSIPERKKILGIRLYIYVVDDAESGDGRLYIERGHPSENLTDIEYTLTYSNRSEYGMIFGSGLILYGFYFEGGSYHYIDLPLEKFWGYSHIILRPQRTPYFYIHSRENTNPPYLEVIYEDVPPDKPTPRNPVGDYKDVFATIRFEWDYNSSVGGVQKKFDLQWSTNQQNWTTISQTTSNTYYDAPGGTFPTGNIYWQVRTYNEYDEASEWSDIQSFYAVGAPSVPIISSVSMGTARPTVEWAAFNQQIFQVQVLSGETVVYDSGEIPGVYVRAHKVTAWLPDGSYTMQVRIKNEYDLWSEWGNIPFTVSTSKPTKPSFSAQTTSHGIELHIQNMADYALIYRAEYGSSDFICIGMTAEGCYHDCSVKHGSEYQYFVRSVSANETYADSDTKLAQAQIRYAMVAPVSDLADIFEFRRALNNPPKRGYTRNPSGSTVEFEGRKYPVWIPTERISAGISLEFFLHSWAAVEKFMSLYDRKETVLYRDSKGRKIYGTLSGLAVEEERPGYTVSFVISQVDHDEEVEV